MIETESRVTFDHRKFSSALEVLREHRGIETQSQLAAAIGVHHEVVNRVCTGEGIAFDSMLKIIAWSKLDLRSYLVIENGAPPRPQTTADVAETLSKL